MAVTPANDNSPITRDGSGKTMLVMFQASQQLHLATFPAEGATAGRERQLLMHPHRPTESDDYLAVVRDVRSPPVEIGIKAFHELDFLIGPDRRPSLANAWHFAQAVFCVRVLGVPDNPQDNVGICGNRGCLSMLGVLATTARGGTFPETSGTRNSCFRLLSNVGPQYVIRRLSYLLRVTIAAPRTRYDRDFARAEHAICRCWCPTRPSVVHHPRHRWLGCCR